VSKKWRVAFLVGLIVLVGFFFYWQYFEKQKYHFRVVFFDVGQGDSALINFSNGKKMLVDCGPNGSVLSKLGGWLPFYDRTIDYLVITHPDLDHYGGCVDVLKNYQVKNVIENGEGKTSDPYWQSWDLIEKAEGAKQIIPTEKYTFLSFGQEEVEFFKPEAGSLAIKDDEGNNRSLVLKLVSRSKSFLFSGDAETPLELALIKTFCPDGLDNCSIFRADYLKIGHHGSDSSTSDEWLEAIRPKIAIVSVGKNKFGHPSLRILRKLERMAVEIWRTDEKNDIIIK